MDNKTPFDRLVIAAYRLPFKLSKTRKGYKAIQNSGGLVSAILALSENFKNSNKDLKNSKIVWAGIANDLPGDATPDSFENENFDILPVTIENDVNDLYYGDFVMISSGHCFTISQRMLFSTTTILRPMRKQI